jgi:hypothetical protein
MAPHGRRSGADRAMSGARYEIAIDGTTRTYRDQEDIAQEAANHLKRINPNCEVTLRDLQTGTVTAIKHPSSR